MITLVSVYQNDQDVCRDFERFLYLLLSERESHINISHKDMPTFANHCKFVRSKPYKEWFIIQESRYPYAKLGSIYITLNDEIGLFMLKQYQGKGYGSRALRFLVKDIADYRPLYANINPENEQSINFFRGHGFDHPTNVYGPDGKLLQLTFVLNEDHSTGDSIAPADEHQLRPFEPPASPTEEGPR